jgi:hypothetical protein
VSIRLLRVSLSVFVLSPALATAALAGASPALALEAPVTEAATGVTGSEATLHGELNPNAEATAGFQFLYNQGGGCEGFGAVGPGTENEQTGQSIKVESPVTGLVPSSEYTFCLQAQHNGEAGFEAALGNPQSFTTAALAPAVDSESASSLTPFAATLEGFVNPENQTTSSCKIEWGTTTAYGNEVACEPESLGGFGDQQVIHRIEGLEPATTYHFRVVVANATGSTEGADSEFTTLTLEKPIVDSESVSSITTEGATLEAQVNPNYQETSFQFEYSTSQAAVENHEGTAVPGEFSLPPVFGDQPASVPVSGLQPGTTYFYRVLATNETGTREGTIQPFTTVGPPIVVTGTAQNVTRSTAELAGGTVDPVGEPVTWYYRYIDQAGYEKGLAENPADPYAHGASSIPIGHLPAEYGPKPLPAVTLTELKPGTTYHFALVATGQAGTTLGHDATFTTGAPTPPAVSTGAASNVTHSEALVSGTVDPDGLDTTWQLQLGSEPGAFNTVATGSAPANAGARGLSVQLSFLAAGVTYHYRFVATNPDGTVYGGEGTFTTQGFAAPEGLAPTPGLVPFTPVAALPSETPSHGHSHPLSRTQKLAKALRACHKKHGHARKRCERQARHRYGKMHG